MKGRKYNDRKRRNSEQSKGGKMKRDGHRKREAGDLLKTRTGEARRVLKIRA